MTVPFYAYQQRANRLSVLRWAPESTAIVVGVHPEIPDHGIQVRVKHVPHEDGVSVILPLDEAVAMALGILAEVGTMAAQQVSEAYKIIQGIEANQERP